MHAQSKLQSSVTECQQLRAKAELKEKQQQEKEHKWQTSLLAEQRQVRKHWALCWVLEKLPAMLAESGCRRMAVSEECLNC